MGQRIKGQEVTIAVLLDGAAQTTLNHARSIDMNFQTERLQEGYMGETSDRYDTIYKGITGRIEFHLSDAATFNVINAIVDKARRREPGLVINIKTTLNFPGGSRVRVIILDCEFGEMPLNFGSRADYGTFSLDFGASEAKTIPAAA